MSISQTNIRIHKGDGSLLMEHRDRMQDWQQFRQECHPWWKMIPCPDPRYGNIDDLGTGEILLVRHSSTKDNRMAIVLKKRNGRVVRVLAHYDRRSLDSFCYACIEADRELFKLAGLLENNKKQLESGKSNL